MEAKTKLISFSDSEGNQNSAYVIGSDRTFVVLESKETKKNMDALAKSISSAFEVPLGRLSLFSLRTYQAKTAAPVLHRTNISKNGEVYSNWSRVYVKGFEDTFFSLKPLLELAATGVKRSGIV